MANEQLLQYEMKKKNDWTVWILKGRLDRTTGPAAGDDGTKLLDENSSVAVNLAELSYISSAGLRVILRLAKKAKADGKKFALCAPVGMVKEVLEEASMNVFVDIFDSEEELT